MSDADLSGIISGSLKCPNCGNDMTKWISVEEDLPKEPGAYLIATLSHGIYLDGYSPELGFANDILCDDDKAVKWMKIPMPFFDYPHGETSRLSD